MVNYNTMPIKDLAKAFHHGSHDDRSKIVMTVMRLIQKHTSEDYAIRQAFHVGERLERIYRTQVAH